MADEYLTIEREIKDGSKGCSDHASMQELKW